MKKTKELKGITLIALVITIVILLILAGISISALTNQGLFEKAKEAKQKYENAQKNESEILETYLAQMNSITFSNVDKTNTNPEEAMPKGAIVVEGNANNGIVIKDSNDNEWTWVEVPKTVVFKTATKADDYDKIKADLIAYASDYREGATEQQRYWTDEWYAMDGETSISASTVNLSDEKKLLKNGCGLSYDEYNTTYQKMLSSIYTNGGFWISRYEIGDSTATEKNETRTRASGTNGTAVSKQNQIPYNYVTCEQAQTLAKGMSADSSKTSSLLFGIQWDLTCKFLETKTNHITDDIKTNSTSWGNYKNNSLTLYRGKYNIDPREASNIWKPFDEDTENYVTNKQTSSDANYMQSLTTGASEGTNKMNIYDFAGNEWEWTLEHATSDTRYPCAYRGGSFFDIGLVNPVANRVHYMTSSSYSNIGFRSTLY